MKQQLLLCILAACTTLFYGCGLEARTEAQTAPEDESQHHHEASDHSSHGVTFKQGEGLNVPTSTRELLGLKLVDVAEGKATRRIDLPLRVFDRKSSNGDSFVLASGSVATNQAGFLKNGMDVEVSLPEGESTHGTITAVNPAAARLTGLAEIIVRIPATGLELGAFVDGTVTRRTEEEVVVIPREALLTTAEGHFAYVVNGDSLFRTEIGVGAKEGDVVEVTEGLYSGDQVVLQPVMPLWLAELQEIRGGKACADGH